MLRITDRFLTKASFLKFPGSRGFTWNTVVYFRIKQDFKASPKYNLRDFSKDGVDPLEESEIDLITMRRRPRDNNGKRRIYIDDINNDVRKEESKAGLEHEEESSTTKGLEHSSSKKQNDGNRSENGVKSTSFAVKPPSKKVTSNNNKSQIFTMRRYGSLEDDVDEVLVLQKIVNNANRNETKDAKSSSATKKASDKITAVGGGASAADSSSDKKDSSDAERIAANMAEHEAHARMNSCFHTINTHANEIEKNKQHFEAGKNSCFQAIHSGKIEGALQEKLRKPHEILSGKSDPQKYTSQFSYRNIFNQLKDENKESDDSILEMMNKSSEKVESEPKKPETLSKVPDDSKEKLESLLSSPENVEILETLFKDIKAKNAAKANERARELNSYEWSRDQVVHPDNAFAKIINKKPMEKKGYFKRGFIKVVKGLFMTAGVSFIGLLTLDIFFPEILNTDQHMKQYELTESGFEKSK